MASKPPAKKSGTEQSSSVRATKGPATRPTPATRRAAGSSALVTWIAVGVVVVLIATVVIVKVSPHTTPSTTDNGQWVAAPTSLVNEVTQIPASVYDKVGVSAGADVAAPFATSGQPVLSVTSLHGATLPQVLYVGAEWCPFCAAERWVIITALSRFGTFSNLGITTSSSTDSYPSTPTFSFRKATYTSSYLDFESVEINSNKPDSANNPPYQIIAHLTAAQNAIVQKYDTPTYIPTMTAQDAGAIPFVTLANQYLISGASYSPAILTGLSRDQIAGALSDPTSPSTADIISAANEVTAALCQLTHQHPGAVCESSAVVAARKSLSL